MTTFFNYIRIKASLLLRAIDLMVTVASLFGAYYIVNLFDKDYFVFSKDYIYMFALVIPTWGLMIRFTNLVQIPRSRTYMSIFFNILNFSLIGFFILLLFKYTFGLKTFSNYMIFVFSLLNCISLFAVRMLTFRIAKRSRSNGNNIHNIAIIANKDSEPLIDKILDHKEWGYQIELIISDSEHIKETYSPLIEVLPESVDIKHILKNKVIDELLYCSTEVNEENLDEIINTSRELGITFKVQSSVSSYKIKEKAKLTRLEKTPFYTFYNSPNNSIRWAWKAISDCIISGGLLFFFSPIILTIIAIIKLTSKGPAIFKQKRVGQNGRIFYIYKFRTMVVNAEALKAQLMAQNESDGPAFKIKHDPRITTIGRFLRKTSLDELPQLFNVLRGEMSLIGPRPPLASEVEQYEDWQLRRLSVKPGITCTWQIIPNRNDVLFDKWMKLDMEYIDKWSLKSDWQLFFKTIRSVLINRGV